MTIARHTQGHTTFVMEYTWPIWCIEGMDYVRIPANGSDVTIDATLPVQTLTDILAFTIFLQNHPNYRGT